MIDKDIKESLEAATFKRLVDHLQKNMVVRQKIKYLKLQMVDLKKLNF